MYLNTMEYWIGKNSINTQPELITVGRGAAILQDFLIQTERKNKKQ